MHNRILTGKKLNKHHFIMTILDSAFKKNYILVREIILFIELKQPPSSFNSEKIYKIPNKIKINIIGFQSINYIMC